MDIKVVLVVIVSLILLYGLYQYSPFSSPLLSPEKEGVYYPIEESCASIVAAHYAFDGNLNDDAYANNGVSSGVTFVQGKIGEAVSFPSESYVTLPNAITPLLRKSFSVSFWMKSTTAAEAYMLSITGQGNLNGRFEELSVIIPPYHTNSEIWGEYMARYYYGSKKVNDGEWHFVTFVVDQRNAKVNLYVDGVLIDSEELKRVYQRNDNELVRLGMYADSQQTFGNYDGELDELTLFAKALNQNDVSRLYNGLNICN